MTSRPRATRARGTHTDLRTGGAPPSRIGALERLLAVVPPAAALIATTGKCGRELFTLADRAHHLYQVGSMGCASAMGLGVALNVRRPVVVLDNGVHDSTGGQATVSPNVDFAAVALACGYARGAACDDLPGFEAALKAALAGPGPHLVHLRIPPTRSPSSGAPRSNRPRFREFLHDG